MLLTHPALVPPGRKARGAKELNARWRTEYDVREALLTNHHQVSVLGINDDLSLLRRTIEREQPDVVFNLLELFSNNPLFESHVVSYLELLGQRYTGCNPYGLMLSRDKALSKKIMLFHKIPTPNFEVVSRGHSIRGETGLQYPLVVKSATEHGSLGISQASIVKNLKQLRARVGYIHQRIGTDALVEEYIDGRELYVGILGDKRPRILPIWEMVFSRLRKNGAAIATELVKSSLKFQRRHGVTSRVAYPLRPGIAKQAIEFSRNAYKALGLSGYARVDLRLDNAGQLYVLEVNANPDLKAEEDFACSAKKAGIPYNELVQQILDLALR